MKQENRTELKCEYIPCKCEVIAMKYEKFLCVSIGLNEPSSREDDWGDNQDIDGGELEL